MFKYFLYRFGQFILYRVPPQISFKLASFISDLQYFFSFRDRKAVKGNLQVILNSKENLSSLAREVFRNFGRYLVEFFLMARIADQDYLKKNVRVQNLERIERVLAEGKGGVLVTAHIGNWELGAVLMNLLGYPLLAIALPHKERPVNELFNHQREFKGITVVPANIAVRRCVEALKENKLIALVADRDFSLHGEIMDFLGRKAFIPKGPAMFSITTGAPIIPVFLIRESNDHFTLSIEEPIYSPIQREGTIEKERLLELMHRYMPVIEQKIRQYPAQWLMFRKFWVEQQEVNK